MNNTDIFEKIDSLNNDMNVYKEDNYKENNFLKDDNNYNNNYNDDYYLFKNYEELEEKNFNKIEE